MAGGPSSVCHSRSPSSPINFCSSASSAAASGWPLTLELEVEGLGRVLLCHATPASDDPIYTRITPEAEVAELKAKGVVFEEYNFPGLKTVNGIATAGGSKAAWFKDTEGNILCIHEDLA